MNQEEFNKLRERFNPEGSLLRRQQMRMLDMLICLDEICTRHNIPYWMSSGTLIGAVRHKGYIPWDDDLDVTILYKDSRRLLQILEQELPPYYKVQSDETDDGYFFCYPKIRDTRSHLEETNAYDRIFRQRGIFIDLFTFEKFPPRLNWIACRAHGFCYNVLNNRRNTDLQAKRKVQRIFWCCKHVVFPVLRFLAWFCPTKELRYSPGTPYGCTSFHDELFPLQRLEFEGHLFNAPRDAHNFLKRVYGDYMTLPDLNKIQPHAGTLRIED